MFFDNPEELKNTILEKTKNFTETNVLNQILTLYDVEELSRLTRQVLTNFCEIKNLELGFRIWQNNHLKDEEFLLENVLKNPIREDESIKEWLNRVIDSEDYCLVINRCEAFDDEYACAISQLTSRILGETGLPSDGMITTILIGNYGYTPFGVHKDAEGACSFNLHLGPGDKVLYNWEDKDFESLDANVKKVPDQCIENATAYRFGAGDIYFMPPNRYHIGYSDNFSISLTVWFNNHHVKRIFKRLFSYIESDFVSNLMQKSVGFTTEDRFDKHIYDMIDPMPLPSSANTRLIDLLSNYNEERLLYFQSNAGFSTKPIIKDKPGEVDNLFSGDLDGKKLNLKKPFKILTRVVEDDIELYLRGRKLTLRKHEAIFRFVDILNTYDSYSVKKMLDVLPEEWPVEIRQKVISNLFRYKSLEESVPAKV